MSTDITTTAAMADITTTITTGHLWISMQMGRMASPARLIRTTQARIITSMFAGMFRHWYWTARKQASSRQRSFH